MKSLKSTIFFFFVALLLAVQGMFLQIVYRAIRQEEANQVQYQLDTARTVFQAQFESRRVSLAAFAETAARDFGLKEVFQGDQRSFLVALNNHRQRIDADLALAITAGGTVSAQLLNVINEDGEARITVGPEQDMPFRFPGWLDLQDDTRLYPLGSGYYQFYLAPLSNGSLVVGWVGFGYAIDRRLAAYFSDLTELNTDFAVRGEQGWTVLASSNENGAAARDALVNLIMEGAQPDDVIATTFALGNAGGHELATVMYGDRTDLLAEIRNRWAQLGLLGALTLLLSLGGAFLIATRISRPVQVLAEQAKRIAGGDYDLSFTLKAGGELGALAEEFRHMQQALQGRERIISHHAYHDDRTGLPNRNRLLQVLEEWTADLSKPFSVSKFSIRRINHINSSLGHDMGDEVIRTVATRFGGIAQSDTLFHLGGSEFVVLNPGAGAEQAEVNIYLLMKLMEPKFRHRGISLYIELQAGIALFPEHGTGASGLLQKASTALQQAKKSALPFQLYHSSMSSETEGYLQLINDLKTAIDQEQLVLHYQPKLDLNSGGISQVEALVRWLHPERGIIGPDLFIPVAEETGLIHNLTRWVLHEAARQHKAWSAQGIDLSIAVNVSAQNLKDAGFYDMVMKSLAESGVGRRAISLEMTESAVMDDLEKALALLGRFDAENIHLSIDDYGTGYSALAQLKRLPVNELKIDRSFVRNLLDDKDNTIIVRSTIELAHNMGLRVVAEGVEDAASLDWLRRHSCDMVQGYHVCRPKAGAELAEWLRREAPVPSGGKGEAVLPP